MGDDFVALTSRFTSGWPWPESSYGLDPMYGPKGWCHECGIPQVPRLGGMVLQASKFPTSAFWVPNWRYDALCVRLDDAVDVISDFDLTTIEVSTPRGAGTGVVQLVPEVAQAPWFNHFALSSRVRARHRSLGSDCPSCRNWRWLPLKSEEYPPASIASTAAFVASAEWFGAGVRSMHELRFLRPLAKALVALNPRVWSIVEVAR